MANLPAGLEDSDFDTIEDAVLETARGRWFLREFARRARAADTSRLMQSISRIEDMLRSRDLSQPLTQNQHARELEERQVRFADIAWMLRERGYDGDICALIEKEARSLGALAAALREGCDPTPDPGAEAASAPRIETTRAIAAPLPEPEPEADAVEIEAPPPLVEAARTLAPEPAAAPWVAPPPDWRQSAVLALAPFDLMSTRESLAFFA